MDRNPNKAASVRVHVRKKDQGLLLTVAIIHKGELFWHRERVDSAEPLSDSFDLAVKHASQRLGLPVVRSQGVLPGI